MVPDVLVTLPPLIVRVPFPELPIIRAPEFVQLPPVMVAVPMLLLLRPMDPLVLVTFPSIMARDPLAKLPMVSEFAPLLPI